MENLQVVIQKQVIEILKKLFSKQKVDLLPFAEITQATHLKFGHYQCNSAMKLAQILKKNPRLMASQIVEEWSPLKGAMIEKLEIAGPGFINIFLTPSFLSKELMICLADDRLGVPPLKKRQKIIVEFSSPNVAKELHVGHLRSTIIGDSLARLFEFLGHEVIRLNHIGDWGTQFGMLIWFLKSREKDVLEGKKQATLTDLMHWYREAKKCFDTDEAFKKKSRLEVMRLQSQTAASLRAWETICSISRKGFEEIYALLDVKIKERGESFYNDMLKEVVEDYEKKGLIESSEGAKCVFLEGFQTKEGKSLPMILQKSDGGYNYATTDTAALLQRVRDEKADRIIYVVDGGQRLHFQMVFQAAEKAGYFDPEKVKVEHVPFGLVLGPDGKKFKTRSGDTEKLLDLLLKAIEKAKKLLKKRLLDLPSKECNKLAEILGIDAVKYADLSSHRTKDYLFSYDRMLNLEGNTAPFLLYAYVRIQGIKRKIKEKKHSLEMEGEISLTHPSEIALGLCLRQFGETLALMDRDLLPNRLSDYLYVLAEKFHAFFRDCRVEGSAKQQSRLLLIELTSCILKVGLGILGLKTMPQM